MGKEGSYINRGPKTNRLNVMGSILSFRIKSPQEIFNASKKGTKPRQKFAEELATYAPGTNSPLDDQIPDYSWILADARILDLVKFIKEGNLDVI